MLLPSRLSCIIMPLACPPPPPSLLLLHFVVRVTSSLLLKPTLTILSLRRIIHSTSVQDNNTYCSHYIYLSLLLLLFRDRAIRRLPFYLFLSVCVCVCVCTYDVIVRPHPPPQTTPHPLLRFTSDCCLIHPELYGNSCYLQLNFL